MGYRFKGLVTLDARMAEVALEHWPFCQLKHEQQQFNGYVLRCPDEGDLHPTGGDAEWELVLDQADQVRSGLSALSNRFPESWLIYVEVECFGGTCQNTGTQYLAGSEQRPLKREKMKSTWPQSFSRSAFNSMKTNISGHSRAAISRGKGIVEMMFNRSLQRTASPSAELAR